MGKKSLVRRHFSIAFRHIYEVLIYLFVYLFIYFPWYRKRNNNADKTWDRSSGANFASRGKLTDRVCGDCHQSSESFGAGGQRWERLCQTPWRRYSTSSTCWPQANGMWSGTGKRKAYAKSASVPFCDHKPGCGCNTQEILGLQFMDSLPKRNVNCFEKCQLTSSFPTSFHVVAFECKQATTTCDQPVGHVRVFLIDRETSLFTTRNRLWFYCLFRSVHNWLQLIWYSVRK